MADMQSAEQVLLCLGLHLKSSKIIEFVMCLCCRNSKGINSFAVEKWTVCVVFRHFTLVTITIVDAFAVSSLKLKSILHEKD